MRVLLDTHTFLWWVTDDRRLSRTASDVLSIGSNDIFFSVASGWEISIKAGLGRIRMARALSEELPDQLRKNGFRILPIQLAHALRVEDLPHHHKDPFDRLLVAQAMVEDLPLLTSDGAIRAYPIETLW